MSSWRGAAALAAIVVLLGGCASDDDHPAIEGQVDFVPADTADRGGSANAGTNGAVAAGASGDTTGKGAPKESKKKCAASVKASNALLDKHVLVLFGKKDLRQIEHLTPEDTFNCDPGEGPDFGGVAALWDALKGADAIKVFEGDGWTREDPEGGAPAWATQGLPHGDGSLNYEPAEKYVVTFHVTRAGRQFWAELTQDGLRAGLDDAA
jgi:hypothetical protein